MSYTFARKLQGVTPYNPINGDYKIRLDANESFIEVPECDLERYCELVGEASLNRYPDPLAARLCALYGQNIGISPELITAGNGSDELLMLISSALLDAGDVMLVLTPDFSMYTFYAELAGARVVKVSKNDDFTITPERVLLAAKENKARAIMFSNPCNPTGLGLTASEVMQIVDGAEDCLVVVDEAYMDFWDESVLGYAEKSDNLIVLKTCSKAYRMAGIRCGFAVAGSHITAMLRTVKSPYNVSSLTQLFASCVLENPNAIKSAIATILEERDYLYAGLCRLAESSKIALEPIESKANFVYVRCAEAAAQDIFLRLKERSIVVRRLGEGLRITAGSREENDALLAALNNILTGAEY